VSTDPTVMALNERPSRPINLGLLAFVALVVLNVVWLVMYVRARPHDDRTVEAYAECRAAIRQLRPDAARIPFPTGDLIRVSERRSARYAIRGFFEPRGRPRPVWYRCVTSHGVGRWHVDSLTFDRQD
jgi:hypothetical protein